MNFHEILRDISTKNASVGIIGQGYVGLPLSILASRRGYKVTGFLRTAQKAKLLAGGETDVDTIHPDVLKQVLADTSFTPTQISREKIEKQDVIIICVPTPITQTNKPDLTAVKSVASMLSTVNLSGKLIINESTVAPGTTRDLFSFLKKDSFLACSPERVDPGNQEKPLVKIAKVVAGRDPESLKLATAFYKNLLDADVIGVSSFEIAEMAKMLENTYRAVNIALVNEIAMLCEALGIDVLEVIDAASSKWSFHAHFPGIGVGGHCIPVDPYYILELAKVKKSPMTVVPAALSRNRRMPHYVFDKLKREYRKGMSVVVYGLSYKRDVSDIRESPSLQLCKILKNASIPFRVYDPHFTDRQIKTLGFTKARRGPVDILIVGTDHKQLTGDSRIFVSKNTVVIDGRNIFKKKIGAKILGVGRTLV